MKLRSVLSRSVLLVAVAAADGPPARAVSDIAACADERVKTAMLPAPALAAAEAACGRVLASGAGAADRQKAALYRGLMRFLKVVQEGLEQVIAADGSMTYSAPTLQQVSAALGDVETAIGLDGPLQAEALALRVTINQTIGRHAQARADLDRAATIAPHSVTALVQGALEHEHDGDIAAAITDLDRAVALDPAAGTALLARGELLRRLGQLLRARADFATAAALGPPYRRLALLRKSNVELRAGNLRAAYDDLVAAAAMTETESDAARAALLAEAGDLALDKLKDPDAAERHYNAAAALAPTAWGAVLGLARVAEQRGQPDKAAAFYRRILAATETTPQLLERMLAAYRLKQLTASRSRRSGLGPFRDAFEIGVAAGQRSPDGLKRIAFVIGQGEYDRLADLPNARRDAAVIANALAEMGFDRVEIAEDLNGADLRGAPAAVARAAKEADIVLVFYAGHGVEIGGANYLIPADATPESDRDVKARALALTELAAAAAGARRGALIVVDACRDDPFIEARAASAARDRAVPPARVPARLHAGLAATPAAARNSVVFHSTQPGEVALDGDDLDSPFVRAFLETLATPGQPFEAVVRGTVARVSEATAGRQIPAAYGDAPAVALLPPPMLR